tara:strand:- start:6 stop:248 length:243 start_codon:yes stop_codon:yes gene_type:complete
MQELFEWFINFTDRSRIIGLFLGLFFFSLSFLFLLINKGEDESLFDILKNEFFSDDNNEIDRKTFQNNQREKFRKRRNKR